ncbi:Nitrilase/cyanide hydratase and apolipoprotein N-acyltransferase [Pedobacter sp. BAL39]|uniref:bifunctional GNAT family N-acetyltransferase/carbon-nitrogen hydrolase family protein n=1 Tax=Pedobacter sp. BAL39 TaxID=391596 RepID=UPI000155A1AB|nr:bifunctional GNAT family N-acetyltransferase/carbon-nitrogen hydrolase family protein [Pedobacter sp. BAL39]EDM38173.1 Nitrilase/cyanide hydratase and apolipoprotein N-acyltransferase [Pedobacter sp. BAL39]
MNIETRRLTLSDYNDLKESMLQAYDTLGGQIWSKSSIERLLKLFPEGQLCIAVDDKVVACSLSIIVDYDEYGDKHTYKNITGDYSFSTHDSAGDVLYGIEIFVHPEFRGLRLGRRLYEARKELCESLNLKSIIAGGRIPRYHEYAGKLSPRQYIDKVKAKEIFDPTLTFQISNDFHVRKVLKNYLPGDHESKDYATLLEWNNIYYQGIDASARSAKTIRIGLVQWQMRLFPDMEAFYEQVEFFVDAVSGYKSDFIMFPEFFNTPLLQPYNHLPEMEAMRMLAGKTEEIVHKIQEYAVSYNVNIISGSMPIIENNKLYNATYLCHRTGKTDEYRKIQITPNEQKYYGMVGGDKIQVFDTDCGKIGILICYDVEFPELSRIYADQGMQILFVPFLTDTQNGYTRVRHCAQARAIENECYVAIAGCVGNLPKVNNMDIQFAQSAVFTPSDFAFPTNAVKAETTPNTEMMLVVDVDLHLLDELHHFGTVKIMKDRRKDLYEVRLLK